LALSDHGSCFNQEKWLKELNETGPDKEDEERAIGPLQLGHQFNSPQYEKVALFPFLAFFKLEPII
jgi:hypothetical protein